MNDDKSFPDLTVGVQTDLMSLTQHYWLLGEKHGGFRLVLIAYVFSLVLGYRRGCGDEAETGQEGKETQEA